MQIPILQKHLIAVEPGTMLAIAGVVLVAGVIVGYYLYRESRRETEARQ